MTDEQKKMLDGIIKSTNTMTENEAFFVDSINDYGSLQPEHRDDYTLSEHEGWWLTDIWERCCKGVMERPMRKEGAND